MSKAVRTLGVVLALALVAGLVAPFNGGVSEAATPNSGTLSTGTPTITYTAGPFLVPNVTGTAGAVICNAVTPCDEFRLTVSVPAGYDAGHDVKITIQWPTAVADFDLYLLDANGAEVRSSASSSDPETVVVPAVSGTYTVRVVPFAPLGQSFTGTLSLVDHPAPPPPAAEPAPAYQNYIPPAGMGTDAGEPSIGANWNSGKIFFQSGLDTLRVTFNDAVTPATATWEDTSAPTSITSLDPILFTDAHTGRTFVSQLIVAGSLSSFTDNDGASWMVSQGSGIASGVDHQTIGGGPFSPSGPGPLGAYPHAVYYCSQDIGDAACALSRDGGQTYGPALPIYTIAQCGGLHGHVKVAPDGTVYVPNKGCGGEQAVAVSTDNGLTWAVRPVPGSIAADSDPSVGIGANGAVYFGYQNGDGHPHVAVSHDRGLTWQHDQDVGTAFGLQNVVFPAVVAGDDDRAAFAFLGTPTGGAYQDQATFQGVWHLYIAHTYDGGQTWVTSDATPADPVQRGSIWLGGGSHEDRNLLDFMDATVDREGRVLVGYADGCIGACVQGGANSFTALASIARQTSGLRLLAQYDRPDLTPTNLVAYYDHPHQTRLTATVANLGTATARSVVVRFLDGGNVIGTPALVELPWGGSAEVSYTWDTHGLRGSHTITVAVDPANTIAESNETNNQLVQTISVR
jgi:hypothetical protein